MMAMTTNNSINVNARRFANMTQPPEWRESGTLQFIQEVEENANEKSMRQLVRTFFERPIWLRIRRAECSRDKLEKQLFNVLLPITIAQFVERAARLDLALADDGDARANLLDLAHDVRRIKNALAL